MNLIASLQAALPAQPLSSTPSLYVVATPLGNIADISLRALALLAAVDVIAAEDTRHSKRLLDAYGVRTRLLAVHQHNEQEAAGGLIALLQAGQHIALISDAGTPAVSDPGGRVVARVRAAGFPVVPIPGPCAAIAALSAAGFAEGGFRFVGFLPARPAARRSVLENLRDEADVLVFYEAPHRVRESVADLCAVFGGQSGGQSGGERELVVARELSKLHEQIVRLPLNQALAWFDADTNHCRGEFVLLVEGKRAQEGLDAEAERVLRLLFTELPLKGAVALAADICRQPRKLLYARALELREAGEAATEALAEPPS